MGGIPGLAEKGIYRDAIQMLLQCPHKNQPGHGDTKAL